MWKEEKGWDLSVHLGPMSRVALCLQGPGCDGPRPQDPGSESEEQASPWARPQLNYVAHLSLFTEPMESTSEETAFHCHRDPLPQPGLTPERLRAQRQLCVACAVCCVFMTGEVVGKSESCSSSPIIPTPA